MSKVVIIGGSGHVGTYLVPRLVEAGHAVVNVSRGQRAAYSAHAAWNAVETVTLDRAAEEATGTFGERIAALEPDIVIDMICFTLRSAQQLVEALRGRVEHFPLRHDLGIRPQRHRAGDRGPAEEPVRRVRHAKAEIETWLLGEARRTGFPATIFRPGHIVGPGWAPLNPAGHFNPAVFSQIARGDELALPNFGLETVHHVHADDVAQMVMRAIAARHSAVGEAFNTVSPQAVNLRGYAEHMYRWFGKVPQLSYVPFPQWRAMQHSPRRPRPPGSTLRARRHTRSRRRAGCLATSHATPRYRRSRRRCRG